MHPVHLVPRDCLVWMELLDLKEKRVAMEHLDRTVHVVKREKRENQDIMAHLDQMVHLELQEKTVKLGQLDLKDPKVKPVLLVNRTRLLDHQEPLDFLAKTEPQVLQGILDHKDRKGHLEKTELLVQKATLALKEKKETLDHLELQVKMDSLVHPVT